MQQMRRLAAAAALAAAAGLLGGCGPSLGTCSGEVTYDGQPVGDGYITFTPADGKGKVAGGPISGGRYAVSGLPPGPKVVRVIAVKKVNFAATSEEMQRKAAMASKAGDYGGLVDPADAIPANAEGNNARVEIAPGDNRLDLHLKKLAKKN
jgi:hypothetical protein